MSDFGMPVEFRDTYQEMHSSLIYGGSKEINTLLLVTAALKPAEMQQMKHCCQYSINHFSLLNIIYYLINIDNMYLESNVNRDEIALLTVLIFAILVICCFQLSAVAQF